MLDFQSVEFAAYTTALAPQNLHDKPELTAEPCGSDGSVSQRFSSFGPLNVSFQHLGPMHIRVDQGLVRMRQISQGNSARSLGWSLLIKQN